MFGVVKQRVTEPVAENLLAVRITFGITMYNHPVRVNRSAAAGTAKYQLIKFRVESTYEIIQTIDRFPEGNISFVHC